MAPRAEPSKPVTMAELTARIEPPAGPTVMQSTHAEAMRKVKVMLKNRLTDPARVEETAHTVLVIYLREWANTYKQGAAESPSTVDRTILDIRRDTVTQILAEIGRAAA